MTATAIARAVTSSGTTGPKLDEHFGTAAGLEAERNMQIAAAGSLMALVCHNIECPQVVVNGRLQGTKLPFLVPLLPAVEPE
jgi:hypothetical protein